MRAYYADTVKHADTMKHRKKVAPSDRQRLRDAIAPALTADEHEQSCALKIPIFTTCNLTINCADELSNLLKGELRCNLVMQKTKCTALATDVIAAYFAAKLREDIVSKPYSFRLRIQPMFKQRTFCALQFNFIAALPKRWLPL